jgi:hypothetical protein
MLMQLFAELLNTLYFVHCSILFYWLQNYDFFLYPPKFVGTNNFSPGKGITSQDAIVYLWQISVKKLT